MNQEEKFALGLPYIGSEYMNECRALEKLLQEDKVAFSNHYREARLRTKQHLLEEGSTLFYLPKKRVKAEILLREGKAKPFKGGKLSKITAYAMEGVGIGLSKEPTHTLKRELTLQKSMGEFHSLADIILGGLGCFSTMVQIRDTYKDMPEAVYIITDLEVQLRKLSEAFNRIIADMNSYMFALYDRLVAENLVMQKEDMGEDVAQEEAAIQRTRSLLAHKQASIRFEMQKQDELLRVALKTARQHMAKLQAHSFEDKVRTQNEKLDAYRVRTVIENVRDYDDLEGQEYLHKKVETLEEAEHAVMGEGGSGTSYLIMGAILVLILGLMYWQLG